MYGLKLVSFAVALATASQAQDFDLPLPDQPALVLPKPHPTTAGCTVTIYELPKFNIGPTKTVWTKTATATDPVECGLCDHVTTAWFPDGPGPVAHFTTTITEAMPTTVTTYTCEPSGSVGPIPTPTAPMKA
ncbi:hypothetical protein E4U55_000419 [Claviceps digitariae]|nr:hypothetical protein E4U55_000419 [Claviceps digitariae]